MCFKVPVGSGVPRFLRVGADMRAAALVGIRDRFCQYRLFGPARRAQLIFCAPDVEIGDRDHMQAAREPRLCKEHGSELASSDQADRHRAASGFALEQHGFETQTAPPFLERSAADRVCGKLPLRQI